MPRPASASRIAALFLSLALGGCQLYWTKPAGTLVTFTADHQLCAAKAGVPMEGDRLLVNEGMYKACLKALGWRRETGSSYDPGVTMFRGLEEDTVVSATGAPVQVGRAGVATSAAPASRVHVCRQTYLMTTNWRDRIPEFNACLSQ